MHLRIRSKVTADWDEMNCLWSKALDNTFLIPIAFVSKSLSNAERDSQHWHRGIRNATWIRDVPSIFPSKRGRYHYRSQASHGNIWEGWSHTITVTSKHAAEDTPAQDQNTIKSLTRPLDRWLIVMTEVHGGKDSDTPSMKISIDTYTQQQTSQNVCQYRIYNKPQSRMIT